ncbi:MAG: hypothetical protein IPO83_10845 [Chitinophagaceae bacterium]|nr:hypothetical protein [Chitinophagaceae bacterium]
MDNEKAEMKSMISCINNLVKEGFTENFMVKENKLQALNAERSYEPQEIKVVNFYRFEGESDPDSNSILYAIETSEGIKGTLADAYGAYADEEVQKFMSEVNEIEKKTTVSKNS